MKMTNSFGKIHKTYAAIGGGAGLFIGGIVTVTVGSPLPVLRLLGGGAVLPPLWLMGLLWFMGYALAGAAVGMALPCIGMGAVREAHVWRGLTFLVLEVTFSFAWYSLSFGSFLLFPAWFCLLAGIGAGIICTLSWFRVYRLSCAAVGAVTVWLIYLALCHAIVILHN